MHQINVAVVGLGYWGPNYLRVLSQIDKVNVKYLCDKDERKLANFSRKGFAVVNDYKALAKDRFLDAVFIVTPPSTHFEIAKLMLESGKHVLVEKPLTMSYEKAIELCRLSEEVKKVLMIGHIYVYNPVFNYIKRIVEKGELGRLYYGVGLRMGLGPIRDDANCLWDLAPHELSMFDYLLGKTPLYVSAHTSSFLRKKKNIYDYATAHIVYDDRFSLTLMVSWYSPEKIRLLYLIGSRKMVKFDDTNKSSPLAIYDKGVSVTSLRAQADYGIHQIKIREGNVIIPSINQVEPLLLQIKDFLNSIRTGRKPIADGFQGARVVAVLEAMEESIRRGGSPVRVGVGG